MVDVSTIQFGTDEQKLVIKLHHRPFPTASHAWDRDAIAATLEVTAGVFKGQLSTLVFSHELEILNRLLVEFQRQVGHVGKEQFELREGTLSLLLTLTKLGHIDIQVKVKTLEVSPVTLTFTIHSDQTYIPQWIDDVTNSLASFPKEV